MSHGLSTPSLIRLMGMVSIDRDGGPASHLSGAQAQIAFARLTLERSSGTNRHDLADTVWPHGLPGTWASALRSVVSRVRAFVERENPPGTAGLVAQGGRYLLRLPENTEVDLESADRALHEAKNAYTGNNPADAFRLGTTTISLLRNPLLPGHDGDWVNTVREYGQEQLVSALELTSMAAAAMGDSHGALRFANEAVKRAPLRESAHRCLILAKAANGNRAEALRSYHELRSTIAEELGTDPAPETQAVYVDLLGSPASRTKPDKPRHRRESALTAPFVGRRNELSALATAWAHTENGAGHMVLVTGEPGVGKTRLVTEAARRVHIDDGLVMFGRCGHGHALPYQPFLYALTDLLAATPADALPELDPAARRVVTAGLTARPDPAETDLAERRDLLAALTDMLVTLARHRPVLLVIDDLHLADEDSLTLLRSVFRRFGADLPLLVVATMGGEGALQAAQPTAVRDAVQDVDREGLLRRLAVPGLTEADVRLLIRQTLPRTATAAVRPARLVDDSGGNAYLLLNMLERDRNAGPARVSLPAGLVEYANRRVAALPHGARRLLRTAAVSGKDFEPALTAEVSRLNEPVALDALDILVSRGLVARKPDTTDDHDRYVFTHDILRRAIYGQFSETQRRWLHARFAAAIEHRRVDGLGRYTMELRHHRSLRMGSSAHGGWHTALSG